MIQNTTGSSDNDVGAVAELGGLSVNVLGATDDQAAGQVSESADTRHHTDALRS